MCKGFKWIRTTLLLMLRYYFSCYLLLLNIVLCKTCNKCIFFFFFGWWWFRKTCRPFFYNFWHSTLHQKCSNTKVFLVRIFLYSDWIQTEYVFSPNTGKNRPEKNSVFGHFSRSASFRLSCIFILYLALRTYILSS